MVIINIFKQLGVNETFFIQFAIVIVIFNLLSLVLFKKLKEVLDNREAKTTKLEGEAHAVYKRADELAAQYKAKIDETHQQAHQHHTKNKEEIAKKNKEGFKSAEAQINAEYEGKRKVMIAEVEQVKNKSLAEVDSLSKNLVQKLIQ